MPPADDLSNLVDSIARSTAQQYAGVTWEDVRQHLWEQILTHNNKQSRGERIVTLQRWAAGYAQTEARAAGAGNADRYWYSKAEIKELLPFIESPEHWSSLSAPAAEHEGGRSKADPALGGTVLAVWADMRVAWDGLSDWERWLLRARFLGSEPTDYHELALEDEAGGRSADALRKAVERAVSKMQRTLGGRRRADGPGTRSVVSNASAQAYSQRVWNGQ